ncbi:hypothetical protein [Psychromonas aquatilis]|uniref:Anti-sigma factor n=1 Tax=Psychromonas aquatilis TaxID=2005072 RepID=A0ABU9GSF7_9GAMM
MSDKLNDHDIVELYHQGAKEQPNEKIDASILSLAKQQHEKKNVVAINKKRFYRAWYGQLSTAASLVIVAVLYFQNNNVLEQSSDDIQQIQLLNEQSLDMRLRSEMQKDKEAATAYSQNKLIKATEKQQSEVSRALIMDQNLPSADSINPPNMSEITVELERINKLISNGNNQQATAALKLLLQKYPTLKADLTVPYLKLLDNDD